MAWSWRQGTTRPRVVDSGHVGLVPEFRHELREHLFYWFATVINCRIDAQFSGVRTVGNACRMFNRAFAGGRQDASNDIAGRGYPHYNSIVAGFALVITVALDLLLIPKIGIVGAALASTAAYSATFVMAVLFYLVVSRRPAQCPTLQP